MKSLSILDRGAGSSLTAMSLLSPPAQDAANKNRYDGVVQWLPLNPVLTVGGFNLIDTVS